jgi:hypothetical protein
VRGLFVEMIDTLKKGHWIDHQTRMVSVQLQLRNNNEGVRFIARYMFEMTQMGAVLPAYDMETLIDDDANTAQMKTWMGISLILTIWFAMLEGVELVQSGPLSYFTNTWNVMDQLWRLRARLRDAAEDDLAQRPRQGARVPHQAVHRVWLL